MIEWTGERFIPGHGGAAILYEHAHRYHLAKSLASGKRVVDLASGEGYGSAVLSQTAESVVGVEIDPAALAHATTKYRRDNLRFVGGDIRHTPLEGDQFDLAVCFEAIEHVTGQDEVLDEARRLLRDDGVLAISTPERKEYSDARDFSNDFHEHEFYLDEFRQFLERVFPRVEIFGQRVVGASALWPLDDRGEPFLLETTTVAADRPTEHGDGGPLAPQFCVAVCSATTQGDPPQSRTVSVFMDADQSFVGEHDQAVEAHAGLKLRVLELETHDELLLSVKARLEHERDELASRAETLSQENAALKASASWRVTRPLRALSRLRSWRPRGS
jgi:SAM-dependent methyltransferase/FtsZ-binding cell division protein ZapB